MGGLDKVNYLTQALYGTLTGGTALTSLLAGTGSVFFSQAPDNATYPYVVFSLQGGGDINITPSRQKDMLYFVRGYSKTSSAHAGSIDTQIDSALHGKTITVTGWANFWTARTSDFENTEKLPNGDKIFMAGGFYRIRLDS